MTLSELTLSNSGDYALVLFVEPLTSDNSRTHSYNVSVEAFGAANKLLAKGAAVFNALGNETVIYGLNYSVITAKIPLKWLGSKDSEAVSSFFVLVARHN